MPHKNKADERVWRRRWWASLSLERKAEKQGKANARATALRRYLDEIKIARGCVDCGFKAHPVALDFDHVHGEKARLVSFCKSRESADAEIAKCEVRCANCHRIKSWERRWAIKHPLASPTSSPRRMNPSSDRQRDVGRRGLSGSVVRPLPTRQLRKGHLYEFHRSHSLLDCRLDLWGEGRWSSESRAIRRSASLAMVGGCRLVGFGRVRAAPAHMNALCP